MSKATLALIIGLIFITVMLFGIAISTSNQRNQPIADIVKPVSPTPTPYATTILSLSPKELTVPASGSASVDVLIDTGRNKVTSVQLEITYNPAAITNVRLTPGTFFTSPSILLNERDIRSGKISYALSPEDPADALSGKGNLARILFSRILGATATETDITIQPKSIVSAEGITQSVLKEATGATITLRTPIASPSATRTATSSAR